MAAADGIGNEAYPREQEIILQACFRPRADSNAGPESAASWFHLHGLSIGIELAEQSIAVFLRGDCEMRDERLKLYSVGLFERWRAAEVGRVRLNQRRVEVVLADQEAEPVSQPGLTIVRAIGGVRVFFLPTDFRAIPRSLKPSPFFKVPTPHFRPL